MTPLLLLPGMMCDARLFAPQTAAFSGTRAVMCAPIGGHDNVQALAAVVQEVVKEAEAAPPSSLLACITPEGCYTQALRMDADNVQLGLASPLCDCGSACVSHMVV